MNRNIFILLCVLAIVAVVNTNRLGRLRRNTDAACGVPKRKTGLIVRGQSFSRGDFPWIVALMYRRTPPSFFCGGTLISSTFVISAAHCVTPKDAFETLLPRDVLAVFGAHDLSNNYETGRYSLSPRKITIHDDWNPATTEYDGDLSLYEFEEGSINFNDFVQPICLWYTGNDQTVTKGEVTGWGRSEDSTKVHENEPKMVEVMIQTNEQCFLDEKALVNLSSLKTFCAGLRNGSGVCNGDSGGGLFVKINNVRYLKGIVSSSLRNGNDCEVFKNAIYTNVQKFRSWIEKITEDVRKVFCDFKNKNYEDEASNSTQRELLTCFVNQTIENEAYVLESPIYPTVKAFDIGDVRAVEYLPRHVGDKFPNLIEFWASGCALTIVRDYNFKNMRKLDYLSLRDNKIATIEAKAFRDLISLTRLDLEYNMIETLHEKLFATLVKLEQLFLDDNRIKSLSPTTFQIPGNIKLRAVNLEANICLNGLYYSVHFAQLENDIRTSCTR